MADARVVQNLKKGEGAMSAARACLEIGQHDSAVNRAYYSAFYMGRAALYALPLLNRPFPENHGALYNVIKSRLGHPGELGDAAVIIRDLFRARRVADYEGDPTTLDEAKTAVRQAEEFNKAVRKWIDRRRNQAPSR